MAELSDISCLYLTLLGRAALAEEKQVSDREYCEYALSWCRDNKQAIQRISELANTVIKMRSANFNLILTRFLESLEKDKIAMQFLTSGTIWARQFAAMLVSVDNPRSFAYICQLLDELTG